MAAPMEPGRREAPITATERGRKMASRPAGAGASNEAPAGVSRVVVGAVMAGTPCDGRGAPGDRTFGCSWGDTPRAQGATAGWAGHPRRRGHHRATSRKYAA